MAARSTSPAVSLRRHASAEKIDQARDMLFQDASCVAKALSLDDAELAEVLDDLVEWFGGRPVATTPRRKAVRR